MAGPTPEYTWFFRSEYPMVLRTVYLILGDRARAEDVTQEAFIQLLPHWRKVSRYERPEAWVRRVAIRLAVRTARRDRVRAVLERETPRSEERPPPDVDLADALRRLPFKQRACVLLFYFEDRPIAEVADILGHLGWGGEGTPPPSEAALVELLREEVDEDAP